MYYNHSYYMVTGKHEIYKIKKKSDFTPCVMPIENTLYNYELTTITPPTSSFLQFRWNMFPIRIYFILETNRFLTPRLLHVKL